MKNQMSIGSKMMAAVAFGLLTVRPGTAADIAFPNADGSGDLMSATAWGGSIPTTDRPKISAAGSYTCSQDGTLPGLSFGFSNNQTATVTLDADRKIDMTGKLYLGSYKTIEFIGGTWDFGERAGIEWGDYGVVKKVSVIQDSCVITNLTTFMPSYNATELVSWRLTNRSVLHTQGNFKPDYFGNGIYSVRIEDGSSAYAGGILEMGRRNNNNRAAVNQSVVVDGADSTFTFGRAGESSLVGDMLSGAFVEARNGGKVTGKGKIIIGRGNADATAPTTNNVMRAIGSGSSMSLTEVHLGEHANSSSNRIEALDGGQVDISWVSWYGDGNGLVCSNGVVNIHQSAQYTGNGNSFVRVQGDRPLVKLSDADATQTAFKKGFRFIFDLPANGYQYDSPTDCPIKSLFKNAWDDGTATFEINGLNAYMKRMRAQGVRTERIRLAYFDTNAYDGPLTATRLAAANALLPEGVTLSSPGREASASDGIGRSLYLEVTAKLGLVVIFR